MPYGEIALPSMFEAGARPPSTRALYRALLRAVRMDISGLEDEYNLSAGEPVDKRG